MFISRGVSSRFFISQHYLFPATTKATPNFHNGVIILLVYFPATLTAERIRKLFKTENRQLGRLITVLINPRGTSREHQKVIKTSFGPLRSNTVFQLFLQLIGAVFSLVNNNFPSDLLTGSFAFELKYSMAVPTIFIRFILVYLLNSRV